MLAAVPDEAENLCQGSILLLNKAQSEADIKKLGQSGTKKEKDPIRGADEKNMVQPEVDIKK
jgi:hypothetical protein